MVARNEAYNLAANLLAYLIAAEYYTPNEQSELWEGVEHGPRQGNRCTRIKELEAQGATDELPKNLPTPVT